MATKKLYFRGLPILFNKCTTFYLIMTSDVRITWDLSIKLRQVLLVTSQFLLKGHKMVNLLLTLKTHISGMATDIDKQ